MPEGALVGADHRPGSECFGRAGRRRGSDRRGGRPGAGGDGANHSDRKRLQNYRIPFMAWGAGAAEGRDLYAINPSFKDPEKSRPAYAGPQPIRNGDLANLATDALDLPAVPGSELDRAQDLNVFGG